MSLADVLEGVVADARRGPSIEQREAQHHAEQLQRDAEQGRQSLHSFIPMAWSVLEPRTPFRHGRHIDVLADAFEDVFHSWAGIHLDDRPSDARDLIVNVPPGHMKSLLCRVFGPAWIWTQRPECRFMLSSYNQDLAIRDNLKFRRLITSSWYQSRWPLKLLGDQNAKIRFENEHTGYSIAVGVGGGTGERFDIGVLDDPHNIDDRNSRAAIKSASDWVKDTWGSRKSDPHRSRSILVMQRVQAADATQVMLDITEPPPRHVCLPARFEADHPHRCDEDWRSTEGELLWPEVYDEGIVEADTRRFGSLSAAGLLQQRPAPAGGSFFRSEWFRRYGVIYDAHDRPLAFVLRRPDEEDRRIEARRCRLLQTVDLASSERTRADYFVMATFAVTPHNDILVLDVVRGRIPGPEQPGLIETTFHRFRRVTKIALQGVAYELTMIQELKKRGLPVARLDADRDKDSRAAVAGVKYENGSVYHPDHAAWLMDFEAELVVYPNGAHDDQVDVVAYAAEETASARRPIRAVAPRGVITPKGRRAPLR